MRLCLAFWKRSPITVRLAALLMVERRDQWPGPEDQVVVMVAVSARAFGAGPRLGADFRRSAYPAFRCRRF